MLFRSGAKYDLDKRSVKRKIAKAGGLLPDPLLKLRQQIAKGRKAPTPRFEISALQTERGIG